MQPHPGLSVLYFIVCLNPTQSQKQGVCPRLGDAQGSGWDVLLQPVINQTIRLPVASGIVGSRLAWKVAKLILLERS